MGLLHYIEIENFKAFGDRQRIELDHPTVLIGPNNSGKTTVIQAIALWSQIVKTWSDERPQGGGEVEINRLAIAAVAVQRIRLLWNEAAPTRDEAGRSIRIILTVGVLWHGQVRPVGVSIRHLGQEAIWCEVLPEDGGVIDRGLIGHAARIGVHILYSMSGLAIDEPIHQAAYLNTLLGQGRTAEVLRNLCLAVHDRDADHARWARVTALVERLFGVRLSVPVVNARGLIELSYEQDGVALPLELGAAGRGLLQMLLILAYLYSREGGVLLIDEPDAHFEVLRQHQVYVLLRDLVSETGSQVILVTHSEAILEAAVDRNLTLVRGARAENVASRKDIRAALKFYGARHYARARSAGHLLYVEGRTDIDMLRALAVRLDHPVAAMWDERANVYFVESNYPDATMDAELERVEGAFGITPDRHFHALRSMDPGLRGLAILDNDGKGRADHDAGALRIVYWRRYEAENYFVTPEVLLAHVDRAVAGTPQQDLFAAGPHADAARILDELVLARVFEGRAEDLVVFKQSSGEVARLLWATASRNVKLSDLAEEFFRRLAEATQTPMLLRKGELHRLVDHVEPAAIDREVHEKLDLLLALWR